MRIRVIILLLAVVGVLTANLLAAQSVQYTDTALMLNKYLRKSDTAQMVLPYLRKTDTANLVNKYLRKTDTANLVNRYLRKTDTASMLLPYLRRGSSGTLNFVPKLTSLNTIGNSQLFDNGTNVGIGTASPSHRLDVNGNARILNYLFSSFNNEILAGVDNAGYYFGNGNNATSNIPIYIGDRASGIIFKTSPSTAAGTEKMRITSGGNVGIGTTNPASNFVVSNAGASGLEINPTGGVGSGVLIQAYNRNTSAYIPQSYYALGHTFNVGTGGATRAVDITSEGNVGIGTASPGQKLTVAGNIGTPNALLESTSTNVNFGTIAAGYLAFLAGSGAERMRITSGGNALINTNSDNGVDKLQVNGSGKFSNNLTANRFIKAGGTSSQYLMADGSISTLPSFMGGSGTLNYVPKLTASNSIGNSQLFDNGTNVGIGTASPVQKLDVVGGNGDGIQYRTATRAVGIGQLSNEASLFWGSGTPLTFFSGSERMRLTGAGNLGIGTTNPGSILELYQATPVQTFNATNTTAFHGMEWKNGGSLDAFIKQLPQTGEMRFSNGRAAAWGGHMTFHTDLAERMRISPSGNIGIGNSSPSNRLDIYNPNRATIGNTASSINVDYVGPTTNQFQTIGFSWANSIGNYYSHWGMGFTGTNYNSGIGDLFFFTNDSERMRIASSGNVGIGTINPSEKIDIGGNGAKFRMTSASDPIYRFSIQNNYDASNTINFYGTGDLNFLKWIYNTNSLILQPNSGNTLIGTITDNGIDKLQVNGTGKFSNNLTANSFIKAGGSSSQYLMADGSISTLPSFMGGSGTLNYIPKLTASNSIGNSQIFDNGTNVGIGTTSPAEKLEITGNILVTGSSGLYPRFISTVGAKSWEIGYRSGTTNYEVREDGNSRLVIANGGNVGIGTANPAYKLDVSGNLGISSGNSLYITQGDIQFVNNAGYGILSANASRVLSITNAGVNIPVFSSGTRIDGNGSKINFFNSGYENWYVGTKPSTTQFTISSATNSDILSFSNSGNTIITASDNSGARQDPINTLTLTGENSNLPYNGFGASLLFKNRAYTSGIVNSARIRSQINNNSIGNNGGSMVFEVTPNVGGTLTPALTLDYNGTALFSNSVTANSFVKVGGTNTQFLMADGSTSNLGSIMSGSGTSGYLSKWTSATSQANSVIYDNGTNVGIGTQTPDNAQDWNRVLNLHGTSHAKFLVTESSGVKVGIFSHVGYNGKIGTESNHNLTFTAGYWNDVMTLTTAGKVGIGTLNPSGQFETYTDGYRRFSVSYPSAFETKLSIGANAYINQHANNEELSISQQYGTGKITFYTGYPNYERMRITSDGNVGIGTANPAAKLDVVGAMGIRVNEDGIGTKIISIRSDFAGVDPAINVSTNNSLLLQTNNIERMRITSDGNVGIGTTAPGPYKLAVEGIIGARKMKITQQGIPWADYVFQDDYQLRSLEALDNYIQQYKHLPEVPTTKEVNENGLDVADTQALLLKKIEELTLYMIELKKENSNIKKELEMVKKSINKKQ